MSKTTLRVVPIPFCDCFYLIPVQVTMFATISYLFGLKLDKGLLFTIVFSALSCTLTASSMSKLSEKLIEYFLRFIPGLEIVLM